MAKNQKTKRTQAKDLAVSEKELTAAEAGKIKGGGKPSKEQIIDQQTPTAIIGTPPPPTGATIKAGAEKKDQLK